MYELVGFTMYLMCVKTAGWMVNSENPDQMMHSAVSDLSLHSLIRVTIFILNTGTPYHTCPKLKTSIFNDRFYLSFFVATHGFRESDLTTIQFRIHPRTKVDPMFQCVYISTPLKSCRYKSSATCAWSMARVTEKTHLNICVNNKGADQPARPRRLISAFVVRCSSFFFNEEASYILKWRTEWYLEFISFS